MTRLEVIEKNEITFVQDCKTNVIHIAKDGKAACNSRYIVFNIDTEYASKQYIGCTRCDKKLEKLGA